MLKIVKISCLFLFLFTSFASAIDVYEQIMVRYTSTGACYKVDVHVYSGRELNDAIGSMDYRPLSSYAVVFWSQDEVSIIKLNSYLGSLTAFGHKGVDQDGREYMIHNASPSSFCN